MRMTFSNAHLVVDPKIGAHHALCTASEVVGGKKVSWVLEADIKNFFGSLDHGWLLRFVEH